MAICKTFKTDAVHTRTEPKITHVGNDREEIGGSALENSTGDGVEGQGV